MRILIFLGIWIAAAASGFGGEKEIVQTLPTPTAVPQSSWSANFEGDYTFGSRIKDFGGFGSQAETDLLEA